MKVHEVKKARKAIPSAGINVGDSYYWWKFRRGWKRVSKTYPKRWQLTQSEFKSTLYQLQDEVAKTPERDASALDTLEALGEAMKDARNDVESQLEDLKSTCEDNLSNMPDSLQEGDAGQLLQTRIDSIDEQIGQLPDEDDFDREDEESDEDYEDRLESLWEAVVEAVNGVDEG